MGTIKENVRMKIDGACHCGRIRYEAEIDPSTVVICHCTDCQTLSGSAFRTVVATTLGSFRLVSGRPKRYVKHGDNGNEREQTFCGHCGTPIYSAPPGTKPKIVGLRVGTIRQRSQLEPRDQYWYRSAQSWLPKLPSIPHTDTQPQFDAQGGFRR
jgi:hypothetical protein